MEKERIALSIKQLDNDPFALFATQVEKGSLVKATVKSVNATEAVVVLADDIEAILPLKEASTNKIDDLTKLINVGDEISVMITNIDKKNRIVNVSIRAVDAKEEADAIKKVKQAEKTSGTTSLGDLLQDKLSQE